MRVLWTPEMVREAAETARSAGVPETARRLTEKLGQPVTISAINNLLYRHGLRTGHNGDSATIPPRPNDGAFQLKDSVPILSRPAAPPFPEGVGVAYEKRVAVSRAEGTTIFVGDMHLPWWHRPTIDAILNRIEKVQPAAVVQVGDLYDMFSQSRFPRRIFITPQDEADQARERAEFWWREVRKRAPDAECWQRKGNHDVRAEKRILERCPEIYGFAIGSINDLFRFEGVRTVMDKRDDLEVAGCLVQHGDELRSGVPGRRAKENGKPTILGHTHRAWLVYVPSRLGMIWEMSVGHVADPEAEALSYTESRHTGWQRGVGLVTNGVPSFIPL